MKSEVGKNYLAYRIIMLLLILCIYRYDANNSLEIVSNV